MNIAQQSFSLSIFVVRFQWKNEAQNKTYSYLFYLKPTRVMYHMYMSGVMMLK